MLNLIEPANMPLILGLAVPYEFYWVLQQPAPLAGMAYPSSRTPWPGLAECGLRHVVNLAAHGPTYDPAPLALAHATPLADLFGGHDPLHPGPEERLIHLATDVVVDLLRAGEGVLVHCVGGTGRTGTVIGCALRLLGVPTVAVLAYLDALHKARGAHGWPESPWQAEVVARICA